MYYNKKVKRSKTEYKRVSVSVILIWSQYDAFLDYYVDDSCFQINLCVRKLPAWNKSDLKADDEASAFIVDNVINETTTRDIALLL